MKDGRLGLSKLILILFSAVILFSVLILNTNYGNRGYRYAKKNMSVIYTRISKKAGYYMYVYGSDNNSTGGYNRAVKSNLTFSAELGAKGDNALKYCKDNNMNTDVCVLIDMGMHSGKNRLVLWDLKNRKVINTSLVAHGVGKSGNRYGSRNSPKFSNRQGSHLSSLGKYEVQGRAYSKYGHHIKYWLKGLEPSNNNARKRVVVLHGWKNIKDSEVYPRGTRESWGCPAVSVNMMKYLDHKLRREDKVLLWIYNDV